MPDDKFLQLDDNTADLLLRRFSQGDTEERLRVLSIIEAAHEAQPLARLLSDAVADVDPQVRGRALVVAHKLNVDSLPQVAAQLLEDEHPHIRRLAVDSLGRHKDAAHIDTLLPRLQDEDTWVRWAALEAVSWSTEHRVALAVQGVLNDEDPSVRRRACELFALELKPIPVADLITRLKDEDEWARFWAVEALRLAQSEQAIDPLIECLGDESEMIRKRAVQALGYLNATKAVPYLKPMLETQPDLRPSIEWALGRIDEAQKDAPTESEAFTEKQTDQPVDAERNKNRSVILKLISFMQGR